MFKHHHRADLLLLLVAMVWGLTFVIVKNAIASIPPMTFNGARFTIAFLTLLPWCYRRGVFDRLLIRRGTITGLMLFGGYSLQTIGLQYTTATNASFITGLSVVLVPLLAILGKQKKTTPTSTAGALSAAFGLGLLTLKNGFQANPGDLLVLGCACCFALHILFVDRYSQQFDTLAFVTVQIGFVALASGLIGFRKEMWPLLLNKKVWAPLIITAIPATTLAYLIQNWAQKFTTPTHTAIIFALEPVFALIFALILLQEPVGSRELAGAVLILTGMLISQRF